MKKPNHFNVSAREARDFSLYKRGEKHPALTRNSLPENKPDNAPLSQNYGIISDKYWIVGLR